jgi:hypothetical protein
MLDASSSLDAAGHMAIGHGSAERLFARFAA